MPNPDLIPEPFAQSGDKNPIPLERAISDPIYRASWKAGFPPDTRLPKDVGGEAPDGLDFNGLFNALSQAVVFLQKGNAYQFDAIMAPYPVGALVRSNDDLTTFQSTIALNSNNPNSNMTGWRIYNGSGFIVDNLTTNDSTKALSAAQGKVIADAFTGTKSTNGYQNLYGGLIIQWGSFQYTSGVLSVNFPKAFPNACLSFGVFPGKNTTNAIEIFQYNTFSKTGFTGVAEAASTYHYFAIGY